MFPIVSLGHLWLNKTEKKLYLFVSICENAVSSLRFHIYNTSVNTHNGGNIADNKNAFSTTGAKHKTNIGKFLLQTFVPFQLFSTFQLQAKPLNLKKTFNRNVNIPVSFSVSLRFPSLCKAGCIQATFSSTLTKIIFGFSLHLFQRISTSPANLECPF